LVFGACGFARGDFSRRGRLRAERFVMSFYVITEPCIGCKDGACVQVCPVDCIHPRKDEGGFEGSPQLFIDPDTCIGCGLCVEECPVKAIFEVDEVPEKWRQFIQLNAEHYGR
jgi:ferredoxin